jgi:hypothetical protein
VSQLDDAEAAHVLAGLGDRAAAREAALRAAASAGSRRDRAVALLLAVRCAPDGELDVENRLAAARLLTGAGDAATALELLETALEDPAL